MLGDWEWYLGMPKEKNTKNDMILKNAENQHEWSVSAQRPNYKEQFHLN